MLWYMERKFANGIKVTKIKIWRLSWIKGSIKVEGEGRMAGQRHLKVKEKAGEF